MIFIFGPLYSGKRAAAMDLLGCDRLELSRRAVWDVQNLAADTAADQTPDALAALADRLAQYDAV
ncbi:MAG: cobinamide kinase, partial [Oscillibacter sp.]|nr:cobinamide kinase [Oscillibacter sp.]